MTSSPISSRTAAGFLRQTYSIWTVETGTAMLNTGRAAFRTAFQVSATDSLVSLTRQEIAAFRTIGEIVWRYSVSVRDPENRPVSMTSTPVPSSSRAISIFSRNPGFSGRSALSRRVRSQMVTCFMAFSPFRFRPGAPFTFTKTEPAASVRRKLFPTEVPFGTEAPTERQNACKGKGRDQSRGMRPITHRSRAMRLPLRFIAFSFWKFKWMNRVYHSLKVKSIYE